MSTLNSESQSVPIPPDSVADISEFGMSPEGWADYWRAEIASADRETQNWRKRAARVVKRYRDEREDTGLGSYTKKYNILWSNVQTMLPAVFGRAPEPVVGRRYSDPDTVARVASMILERALRFQISSQRNFVDGMRNALQDRLLPGLGTVWVRYQVSKDSPTGTIDNDVYTSAMGESAPVDYVYWEDFGYIPARVWEEVPAVWRVVYMTREQLVERFGEEIGGAVVLDYVPARHGKMSTGGGEQTDEPKNKVIKQARIFEIWDKRREVVTWLSQEYPTPLDVRKDPMGFPGFFPCPKPLFATNTTGNTLPVPDYVMYQDQAQELDSITQRLFYLTKALKIVGVYDGSQLGIQRMLTEGVDNQLIPVDTWAAFAEKGGIKGCIDFLPLEQVATTVSKLYEIRQHVIEDIYQITGISDIVRGAGNPNETATAQRIKAQFASIRLEDLKSQMGQFVTDTLRLMAHVMTQFFDPQTLVIQSAIEQTLDGQEAIKQAEQAQMQQMAQQQQTAPGAMPPPPGMSPTAMPGAGLLPPPNVIEQAIQLLKRGRLADFRIDVEAESMVEPDIAAERDARSQFLTSITQFMQAALPAAQQQPSLAPIVGALLTWGIRGFRVGRDIEGVIDNAVTAMNQEAKQAQAAGPKPDPKAEAEKQKMMLEVERGKQEMQFQAQENAMKLEQMQKEHALKMQQQEQEFALKMQQLGAEAQAKTEASQREMQNNVLEHAASMAMQQDRHTQDMVQSEADYAHERAEASKEKKAEGED